jgi:DNA-directed RNA polymerase specialized sigma24 family protein
VKKSEEDEFRAFVITRLDRWRRTAYLLCHDWHTADDLVAVVVGKLYRHWRRRAWSAGRSGSASTPPTWSSTTAAPRWPGTNG